MIVYNWPIVTIYKSVLAMFVSPTDPKAVAIIDVAFSGILTWCFRFYYNCGSDCITQWGI